MVSDWRAACAHELTLYADLKLHLQSTDYGNFLANEPGNITVSVIDEKLKEKLVTEFTHLRNQALEPLATFLDYITCVCAAAGAGVNTVCAGTRT
jgi:vacuolar-type H+-ATPase subunit C/Vma6